MTTWLQLVLLAVLGSTLPGVLAETGCPPAEDVEPCICNDFPSTRLTCKSLLEVDDLRKVFENSKRYSYHEVSIRSSVVMYIPHEIFNHTNVKELFVIDSTLVTLFDKPPSSDLLYKIEIDGSSFQRGNFFESGVLKNITSLRVVRINGSTLPNISSNFSSHLPESIREISFNNTKIQRIVPRALDGLPNLDKFALQHSQLLFLTRGLLPRPFNVRFFYLDYNKLKFIPQDLFTDMPNLQFLTLQHNYFTAIPEAAFSGRSLNVPYLRLEGNPLECNCLLVWLIKDKPQVIDGTCSKPARLQGRQLQNLSPADFNC